MSEENSNPTNPSNTQNINNGNPPNRSTNSPPESFLKRHGLLIIGVILYIVVYIISNKFPVWLDYEAAKSDSRTWVLEANRDYASGGFMRSYFPQLLPNNRIFKIIPLDFLYYGIADIAGAVHFDIFFAISIITYATLFLDKVLSAVGIDKKPVCERYITEYLYGNIMFYPLGFAIRFLDPLIVKGIDAVGGIVDLEMPMALKIVFLIFFLALMLFVILGFLLPMLINNLFFFLYLIGLKPLKSIIVGVDSFFAEHFGNGALLHDLSSAVVVMLILLAYNILAEAILQKCQKLSVIPIALLGSKLSRK